MKKDLNGQLRPADVGLFSDAIRSPEMVEGMTAFLERRDPDWPRGPERRCGGAGGPSAGTAKVVGLWRPARVWGWVMG